MKAPAGSYDLYSVLRLYSNTTLDLRGVSLTRTGTGNMLRVGDEDGTDSGATGYDAYRNITLLGGSFDGQFVKGRTIIKAFHTTGFTMDGCTLLNESDGHMMEFAGVGGLTVRNCTFRDQTLTKGKDGYEVIQLDVLHPNHITNGRSEDLCTKNVLIENCSFRNVPRAIGSHTAVLNNPHDGIVIQNNTFTDIGSIAIQGMGWKNVDIRGNTIDKAPRGITVFSIINGGNGTYLSSKLAALGSTKSHVKDTYQKTSGTNIKIRYNVLKNIGTIDDVYASYESQGIAVLGAKIEKVAAADKDGSGALPVGDYYIDGASVNDNYIDIRGNGVRIENVRNVQVQSNEIICTKNTVHPANYYGIVFRSNVQADQVSLNTIMSAEVNGIHLLDSSAKTMNRNWVQKTGKYGIVTYNSTVTNITDNDILNATNQGLRLLEASKSTSVKENRVRNCGGDGINISADSSAGKVESNTVVSSGKGITYTKSANKVTLGTNYTSSKTLTKFELGISGARAGVKMGVNTSVKLTPDVQPVTAFATFTYSSSDSSVASVDKNGRITAKKAGYATVTVVSNNKISVSFPVLVENSGEPTYLSKAPQKPSGSSTQPVHTYKAGDADGDGKITITDATAIQRYLAGAADDAAETVRARGDLSGAGVNVTDAAFIQRYLAGMAVPYPVGEDMPVS